MNPSGALFATGAQRLLAVLLLVALAGCGMQPFRGSDPREAGFLARSQTQVSGSISVTAAVPDAAETKLLTGLDLYGQGIQPVWLTVENHGEQPARIALRSIDRDYYSPIEVAYMNRGRFSSSGYEQMQRWFYDNGLHRSIPPGGSTSGFVFTHLRRGTKGFNLDIFSAHRGYNFTFFVPIPGFEADYTTVDFAHLYAPEEIRELDYPGLKTLLENEFDCCATGPEQSLDGGPLNVVFVATPLALRRALLRGQWLESRADSLMLANARKHQFMGRGPDAIFFLDRPGGKEMLNLHVWLAPWEVDGTPVWIGQVYYREVNKALAGGLDSLEILRNSAFLKRFMRESVAADVDSAARFLLQNFWYNQSLDGIGVVTGAGAASQEQPRITFDGIGYFTDGLRYVIAVPETPVDLGAPQSLFNREFEQGEGKP